MNNIKTVTVIYKEANGTIHRKSFNANIFDNETKKGLMIHANYYKGSAVITLLSSVCIVESNKLIGGGIVFEQGTLITDTMTQKHAVKAIENTLRMKSEAYTQLFS